MAGGFRAVEVYTVEAIEVIHRDFVRKRRQEFSACVHTRV